MARPQPTHQTNDVMAYIIQYKSKHDGVAPTVREICIGTGITSTSQVHAFLRRLERAGLIRTQNYAPRSIEVIGGCWQHP